MFKLRKVAFSNHPILGNLALDFCDAQGNAVDTVLIAGENGTGKSALLNALFLMASGDISFCVSLEYEEMTLQGTARGCSQVKKANFGLESICADTRSFGLKVPALPAGTSGIFSDVDINFSTKPLNSVTSLALDENQKSYRSSSDFPNMVKQLLIDVQAQDDALIAHAVRSNSNMRLSELQLPLRMPRFSSAFAKMFSDLQYDRIENQKGNKSICFKKNGTDIPLEKLSSGEKQIVFRGCFLLKDVNAMKGAFVFIDEPEISLHPTWQLKIMDYYKGIFTDETGKQTSQIFAVTHSPFVLHNSSRRNDKVIVLTRDNQGRIVAQSKPEYFNWASEAPIVDAFSEAAVAITTPTVYVEGITDERYFNKTVAVFGMVDLPFQIKSIGGLDANGRDVNSGAQNIKNAIKFFSSQKATSKVGFVLDCDTNAVERDDGKVVVHRLPQYENGQGITRGIENALVLDGIDISACRREKKEQDGYGGTKIIPEFDKNQCCNIICALPIAQLKIVLHHLHECLLEMKSKFEGKYDG